MKNNKLQTNIVGYAFVMPAFILIVCFMIIPIFMTVYMSFFNKTLVRNVFIGLGNYQNLVKDTKFLFSLLNTLKYVLVIVPSVVIVAMFLSSVIVQKSEMAGSFFRGMFYIPTIASAVTVSIIWNWIFNPVAGIANYLLSLFGQDPISWFSDRTWAFICVCIVSFMGLIGQPIILYTASMNGISTDYYEVADIEGASQWLKFWRITVPSVRPTTLYITIIAAINAFQIFIPVQLLTSGGPVNATSSLMYILYTTAFTDNKFGYASAMGVILLVVLGTFSAIQFKVQNRKD